MSKGYFVMKTVVFHNQEAKETFLSENPDYIHISRKDVMRLFSPYQDKDIECKSCIHTHTVGKIQWSKLK